MIPGVDLGALSGLRWRELGIRFAFGFAISVVAALLAMRFGPRFGGMFLGFPAILPASLTLIEQKQHSRLVASINATGAVAGGIGLVAFALLAVWALPRLPLVWALGLATLIWLVVAVALYFLALQLRPVENLIRPRDQQ